MKPSNYIIVGDSYEDFANGINVITVSDLYERLSQPDLHSIEGCSVYLGQGISSNARRNLVSRLGKLGAAEVITSRPPATCDLTHKITEDNVLISCPKVNDKYHHEYDLIVGDKIDRLSDHITGLHIGAMPLMEAVRQASISILEQAYVTDQIKFGLVLNSYRTEFVGYLFPVAATLHVVLNEVDMHSDTKINVVVDTDVIQCGVKVATISLGVTLIEKAKLDNFEVKRAKHLVKKLLANDTPAILQRSPAHEIASV